MLKSLRYLNARLLVLVFVLSCVFLMNAQNSSVTNRTPEQEAKKQTEKMQKELNLSDEQAKKVYKLNLKYAEERKASNSRVDALKRIRKKDKDLKKVLKPSQYKDLKSKRSNVNSVEIDGKRRYSTSNYSRSSSSTSSDKNTVRRYASPASSTMRERSRSSNRKSSRYRQNLPVKANNKRGTSSVQPKSRVNVYGNRSVSSSRSSRRHSSSANQPSRSSRVNQSRSTRTVRPSARRSNNSRRTSTRGRR